MLRQVRVTYWVYFNINYFSFGGPIILMTVAVMTKNHKKCLFGPSFCYAKILPRDLVASQ